VWGFFTSTPSRPNAIVNAVSGEMSPVVERRDQVIPPSLYGFV
jgi:hypothetical protein